MAKKFLILFVSLFLAVFVFANKANAQDFENYVDEDGNVQYGWHLETTVTDASTWYFNEDGTKMDVEFYSTVRNEYYKETNQYSIDLSESGFCAHNYELMFDNTHHWYECGCEAFTGLEPHNFSEVKEFLTCDCGLVLRNPNYKKEDKEGCNGAVIPSLVSVGIIGCNIFYLKIKKKED